MSGKFDQVPVDPETEVRKSRRVEVDGYPALHQQWNWQGISGESLIFADNDIAELSNTALKQRVQGSDLARGKGPVMLQRPGTGFALVHFNHGA